MTERARWETLRCACGSERFVKLYGLRRHPQGGLSEDASGLQCAACQTVADTGVLWQELRRRNLIEQLHNLETDLAALSGGKTPAEPTPPPGS